MKLINTIKIILQEAPSLQFRRRQEVLDKLLKITMESSYLCDFESEEHFLNAIYEEFEYSYDRFFERTGIDRDIALNYLRNEKKDFIYNYYQLRKPECL